MGECKMAPATRRRPDALNAVTILKEKLDMRLVGSRDAT
jgi:hypothetical protein